MRDPLLIRSISFAPADAGLQATGLFGFLSLRYGDLFLDGISLRRTREGRYILSFPEHRRGRGRLQQPVRPASSDARLQIETAVLSELRRQGVLP